MTQSRTPIHLVGEEISGEWNSDALSDIAQAFGGTYLAFNGTDTSAVEEGRLPTLSGYDYLMAAENLPGARSIFSFRPPPTGINALLVGNEAKGLRRRTVKQAHAVVEIPLVSRNINCLNVAAAAAVMLYYLSLPEPLNVKQRSLGRLQQRRPEILLVGGCDPMELGSTVRSACAFGWERVFLEDRGEAWYECDRRMKSQGRGAARRGRNPIKVIPHRAELLDSYRKTVVLTTHRGGRPLHETLLTEKDLLIVLPDETASSTPWLPPAAWTGEVTYAALPAVSPTHYHYRQVSTIGLAEIARQLGEPSPNGIYLKTRKDRYRRTLAAVEIEAALTLEDLTIF